MDGGSTHAQSVSNEISSLRNTNDLQQYQITDLGHNIERLEKHLEYDDNRLNDLQDDQHTWKGIVVGIGSVMAILELLQALGFARKVADQRKTA